MKSRLSDRIAILRFRTWLPGVFAVISLIMASTGFYGVLATHEVGIRIACSLALGRVIRNLLFQTSPGDAAPYVTVTSALLLVALTPCIVPALRPTRVDPLVALRSE